MKKVNQALIDRLVRQTQQGKTEAFGEIYDIYFQQIYKYVFYKVAEEHVEDLVAGVFVKAWTNIKSYKKTSFPFQAWLFRIAHNSVIDHYRTNKEFYELEERLADENDSINPKHILERQLTGERVQRALRLLENKYHEVLQLKFMHDLSNREIADVLHTNEGNVRTLQFRGLKKLRSILEEEEKSAEIMLERQHKPAGILKRLLLVHNSIVQTKKNFIQRNEGFVCGHCGFENGPQEGSCRNHCRQCLYSRHVDDEVPGDRASACKGLMKPIGLDAKAKKGQMIVHECVRCKKIMRNKVAEDDDLDAVIRLGLEVLKG